MQHYILAQLLYVYQFKENNHNQGNSDIDNENDDEQEDKTEKRRKYFSQKSNYTPETRVEMQKVMEEIKEEKENVGDVPKKEKKTRPLFMKYKITKSKKILIQLIITLFRDGQPFNINEPKLDFSMDDSCPAEIILTLHLWKHLDTETLDLDVQPNFIR